MKKFWIFIIILTLGLSLAIPAWTAFKASDGPVFLDTVAGQEGAGYNLSEKTVEPIMTRVLKAALIAVGLTFFIFIFVGGYKWFVSRGEEEKIKSAKDMITASLIGIVIIIGSYAMTNLVFSRMLGTKTSTTGTYGDGGTPGADIGCCLQRIEVEGAFADTSHWINCMDTAESCASTICIGGSDSYTLLTHQWLSDVKDKTQCDRSRQINENGS